MSLGRSPSAIDAFRSHVSVGLFQGAELDDPKKLLVVDDVDEVYDYCVDHGLDVTWPPADLSWNVREMHVRYPDGHILRINGPLDSGKGDKHSP